MSTNSRAGRFPLAALFDATRERETTAEAPRVERLTPRPAPHTPTPTQEPVGVDGALEWARAA